MRYKLVAFTILKKACLDFIDSKVRALESVQSVERLLVERVLCSRRILKHRSTCGSGNAKLATHSATYSERV